MRHLATTTAAIAILAIGASAIPARVSAQQYLYQRPMPRSSQGGADQLRDLVEQAPGFEANGNEFDVAPDPDMLLAEDDLDALVAPVALYPDKLLAQILVAATHPLDVVQAERLLADSEGMSDDELSTLIAEQDWDPSVMVLMTGFPDVINMMAVDLDWTEDLGNAMLMQDTDVLASIQRRRHDAYSAGNLVSNEAQQIDRQDGEIYIQPTDPERVYVPYYDSQQVYSTRQAPAPAVTGNQNPIANPLVAGALAFGSALLVTQLFGGDDDDDDDDWDDYWDRERSIDWRGRDVYARPDSAYRWGSDRDRYWNRSDGRWRRDAERERSRVDARRDALRWLERDNEHREEQLKQMRQRERVARLDARRLDERERDLRERAERLEKRQKAEHQAKRERIERRADREEQRAEEARKEQRQEEQAREERRREERAREQQRKEETATQQAREERDARKARDADREKRQEEQARKERRDRKAKQEEAQRQKATVSSAKEKEPKKASAGTEQPEEQNDRQRKNAPKKQDNVKKSDKDKKSSKQKCKKGDKNCD
jgi:hypothetical protein